MAETTTKRGRGRPKKEVLLRQVSVGIYYQSPNYFRPVQVAQFNVSEKTGDFDHTIINSDPTVVKPSLHGLGMCLDSGFPRYESIDSKTGEYEKFIETLLLMIGLIISTEDHFS